MTPIHAARYREIVADRKTLAEALHGIQSSDERGRSVWTNILRIFQNNKDLASGDLTPKQVQKYNDSVSDCMRTIVMNLTALGADAEYIAQMTTLINNGDSDNAYILLLKLLVKRNPGLYSRKLAASQSAVKQK